MSRSHSINMTSNFLNFHVMRFVLGGTIRSEMGGMHRKWKSAYEVTLCFSNTATLLTFSRDVWRSSKTPGALCQWIQGVRHEICRSWRARETISLLKCKRWNYYEWFGHVCLEEKNIAHFESGAQLKLFLMRIVFVLWNVDVDRARGWTICCYFEVQLSYENIICTKKLKVSFDRAIGARDTIHVSLVVVKSCFKIDLSPKWPKMFFAYAFGAREGAETQPPPSDIHKLSDVLPHHVSIVFYPLPVL